MADDDKGATPTPAAPAEPEPKADPPAGDPPAPDKPDKPDEPLGEAGKKALDTEREQRREAERKAREAEARVKELENEKLSDTERVQQEAKDSRERAEALEARVKRGEVLSAATGKDIANPNLAAELIDPSKVELDDDGRATNAGELLDELLERYPDLKAKPKDEERERQLSKVLANGDRVEDKDGAKSQLSSTEGMTPEEITKALEEGRLNDYLKK